MFASGSSADALVSLPLTAWALLEFRRREFAGSGAISSSSKLK